MIRLFGKVYLHFSLGLKRTSYRKWERRRWEWIWHKFEKMQAFEERSTVKVWGHKVYQPIYFVFLFSVWREIHNIPFYESHGPVDLSPECWFVEKEK